MGKYNRGVVILNTPNKKSNSYIKSSCGSSPCVNAGVSATKKCFDDWYVPILDEAKEMFGLIIKEFDVDRRRSIKAELEEDPEECVKEIRRLVTAPDKLLELADYYELVLAKYYYNHINDLDSDEAQDDYNAIRDSFEEDITDYYLKRLMDEYDYITSKEYIVAALSNSQPPHS